jgi:hypothetical protein
VVLHGDLCYCLCCVWQVTVTVHSPGAQKNSPLARGGRTPTHQEQAPAQNGHDEDGKEGSAGDVLAEEEPTNALTSRDESEPTSRAQQHTDRPSITSATNSLLFPDGSERASFGIHSSFASSGSFLDSNRTAVVQHRAHTHSSYSSRPTSMDVGHLLPEDVSSKSNDTNTFSVRSQGSVRSVDSNKSETFMNTHVDTAELSAQAESHFGSPKAMSGNNGGGGSTAHAHSHGSWNNKVPMRKPALESIISESNFSQLDESEDSELDGQRKFSVKHKPGSVSVGTASHKGNNKIALIEEGDEEEEAESGAASGVRSLAVDSGKHSDKDSGKAASPEKDHAFSESNLKRALQVAVSLAESSSPTAPRTSSDRDITATAAVPRRNSAESTAPASVSLPNSSKVPSVPNSSKDVVHTAVGNSAKSTPASAAPHTPVFPAASPHVGALSPQTAQALVQAGNHGATQEDAAAAGRAGRKPSIGDEESLRSRTTMQTTNTVYNINSAYNPNLADSQSQAAAADKKHTIAYKINKQLHKIQKDIVELKEVARSIMQMYIHNGAPNQLNLPGTMRLRTEAAFDAWNTSAFCTSSTGSLVSLAHGEGSKGMPAVGSGSGLASPPSLADDADSEQPRPLAIASLPTEVELYAIGEAAGGAGEEAETVSPLGRAGAYHPSDGDRDRTDGGNNDAAEAIQQKGVSGISGITKLSNLSNDTYGASFSDGPFSGPSTVSTTVNKLANLESADFKASAAFLGSLGEAGQQQAAYPGGVGASMKFSLIPAPIKIPELSSSTDRRGPPPSQQFQDGGDGTWSAQTTPNVNNAYNQYRAHLAASTDRSANAGGIRVDYESAPIESLDLTFIDLFRETKGEILKLLRDDKFPRWKQTHDFALFLASVKPYEKERHSGSLDSKERVSDKEKSINSYER